MPLSNDPQVLRIMELAILYGDTREAVGRNGPSQTTAKSVQAAFKALYEEVSEAFDETQPK